MKTADDLTDKQKAWLMRFVAERAEEDKYFDMNKAEASVWRERLCSHAHVLSECGDSIDDRYIKDTVLNKIGKLFREIKETDVFDALEINPASGPSFNIEIMPRTGAQELVVIRDPKRANAVVGALGIGTVATVGAAIIRLGDYVWQPLPLKGVILSAKSVLLGKEEVESLTKTLSALGLVALVVHPTQLSTRFRPVGQSGELFTQSAISDFRGKLNTAGYEFN